MSQYSDALFVASDNGIELLVPAMGRRFKGKKASRESDLVSELGLINSTWL